MAFYFHVFDELHFAVDLWRKIGCYAIYCCTAGIKFLLCLDLSFLRPILCYEFWFASSCFMSISVIVDMILNSWSAKVMGVKGAVGYIKMKVDDSQRIRVLNTYAFCKLN